MSESLVGSHDVCDAWRACKAGRLPSRDFSSSCGHCFILTCATRKTKKGEARPRRVPGAFFLPLVVVAASICNRTKSNEVLCSHDGVQFVRGLSKLSPTLFPPPSCAAAASAPVLTRTLMRRVVWDTTTIARTPTTGHVVRRNAPFLSHLRGFFLCGVVHRIKPRPIAVRTT